jgi:hypothetical protein
MSDGGKGSSPRPYSVDRQTFGSNWDLIFGKKPPQSGSQDDTPPPPPPPVAEDS